MSLTLIRPEKRQNSSDEQLNSGIKAKKSKSFIMAALLQCPVCLEVPRLGAGPILGK